MRTFQLFFATLILSLSAATLRAQTSAPSGFSSGAIVLADGSRQAGFIKDNIRSKAALVFFSNGTKTNYDGAALNAVEIGDSKFICINGDFFRVISNGQLDFLQKSSDASGKPSYNGSEAVFSNGTEGRIGDYFIFNTSSKSLVWMPKNNFQELAVAHLAGNTGAIEKAKSATEVSGLKDAVDIYNSVNK